MPKRVRASLVLRSLTICVTALAASAALGTSPATAIGRGSPSVTINQSSGQSDPTSTSPIVYTVIFSEAVTGFTATDVNLSSSTAGGDLVATVSGGSSTYTVDISGMTTSGNVVASIPINAAKDSLNRTSFASTSTDNTVSWQTNTTPPPTVTINQGANQVDPTGGATIHFTAVFSQPVSGLTGTDIDLSSSTAGGDLIANVTGGPRSFTIAVTGMTTNGNVTARIPANAAINASSVGNTASTSTDNTVTFQHTSAAGPSVTINQGANQVDPTSSTPVHFTAVFSQPVSGLTGTDIDLSSSTAGGDLVAAVTGGPRSFTIAVTGMTTNGNVTARIPAGAAINASSIPSTQSTSTDNTVSWQNTSAAAPTVTINQGANQVDPTSGTTIRFTAVFSQPVSGLTGTDIDLSSSTAGGDLVATVSGGPRSYTIAVTGMTTSGNVIVRIPANAAINASSIGNTASTSTDNTVTFE